MRTPIVLLAAACAAAAFCGTGCSSGASACSVLDYAPGHAYPTPRAALQSVLAQHIQWLSASGWAQTGSGSGPGLTFTSGTDSVNVLKVAKGWEVGAVTACQP